MLFPFLHSSNLEIIPYKNVVNRSRLKVLFSNERLLFMVIITKFIPLRTGFTENPKWHYRTSPFLDQSRGATALEGALGEAHYCVSEAPWLGGWNKHLEFSAGLHMWKHALQGLEQVFLLSSCSLCKVLMKSHFYLYYKAILSRTFPLLVKIWVGGQYIAFHCFKILGLEILSFLPSPFGGLTLGILLLCRARFIKFSIL